MRPLRLASSLCGEGAAPNPIVADHCTGNASRVIRGTPLLQPAKLKGERNAGALLAVVAPTQSLPVRDLRPTTPRVRVDVIGFEALGLPAATKQPAVMLTTPALAKIAALSAQGEPAHRITRT